MGASTQEGYEPEEHTQPHREVLYPIIGCEAYVGGKVTDSIRPWAIS